tara:strand:- start:117 stop:491 length:375 start_codon:yes stop_codon:yes gene_type:complete
MNISLTVFLLTFLGAFTIIVGLSFLKKENREKFFDLEKNNSLLLGFFSLLVCLPIVILHNIWTGPWEIFVSLMGWSGLLKGINRIVKIPVLYEYRIKKMKSTSNITGWIMIIFGSIMLYGGLIN